MPNVEGCVEPKLEEEGAALKELNEEVLACAGESVGGWATAEPEAKVENVDGVGDPNIDEVVLVAAGWLKSEDEG